MSDKNDMFRVKLFGDFPYTMPPSWWENFCNDPQDINSVASIDERLKSQYHSRFIYETHSGDRFLEFEDKRDYLAMVLKWS